MPTTNSYKIRTKRKDLFLRVSKGHFATSHSHINYYIDVTTQKSRLSEASALAKELGPSGITVNCVAPGVIDTDMNASLDGETMMALCDETPLCRLGEPRDVAEAILWLTSGKADFVTGQCLGIDGGFGL